MIPGSSLKGALRAQMEQFLVETYYDDNSKTWHRDKITFQPCMPTPRPTIDEQVLISAGKLDQRHAIIPVNLRSGPKEG